MELERKNVATVTVVTDAFAELGREVSVALGAPALPVVIVPHPLGGLTREEVLERSRRAFPEIVEAWRAPRGRSVARDDAAVPRVLDVSGSWETVNDYCYAQGWTDGLPIAPPVETRVAELVAFAHASAQEVIGVIPPRMGLATIEKVAVNAVMAGCEPRYFPVVVAAVKAMCAPEFNLLPMQATTNPVTPLVIVNGPIARELQLNSGCNVFGPGWKANATIGRAVRFVLLNGGGGVAGRLDHACHGQPGKYSFCIAENEDASPWEPFHIERGFAPGDNTVSVIGVAGTQDIIHYARIAASQILDTLVHAIPREGLKNLYSGGQPLLVFGPEQAKILGGAGLTKEDVKREFYERARVPLQLLNEHTIALLRSRRPQWFDGSTPAAVPLADSVSDVQVLIAGGAGNHTCFLPTWGDTRCVTVKVN